MISTPLMIENPRGEDFFKQASLKQTTCEKSHGASNHRYLRLHGVLHIATDFIKCRRVEVQAVGARRAAHRLERI